MRYFQDAGTFSAAQRGQFVGASFGELERDFIVLCTLNGWFAVNNDLTLSNLTRQLQYTDGHGTMLDSARKLLKTTCQIKLPA